VTADPPRRPTREEIARAEGARVPDVIGPGLAVLFVGINPGLYSGAVGHHFARPGNRFWRALQGSGLTPRLLSPYEERELLEHGLGITNLVERATATADQLGKDELRAGTEAVERKVRGHEPGVVAFLGVTAYRTAYGRPKAVLGPQAERLGTSAVWVLPNPSGLNAHYQLPALVAEFGALKEAGSGSRT
jgi:double-stranded uracil-DNA glycosylase